MDKKQADAIAQAILQPALDAQRQIRGRREIEAAQHLRKRRIAVFTLAGCAMGAAVAGFSDLSFSQGVLYGGLAASALGWLLTATATATA